MREEIWIDGFNLFYAWPETAAALRRTAEIGETLTACLQRLAVYLGRWRPRTIVFLDGGLTTGFGNISGLRVRYAGPGRKADDLMRADLGGDERRGRRLTVVSNDRGLRSSLKAFGVETVAVSDFLTILQRLARQRRSASPSDQHLSAVEVEEWVRIFSEPLAAPDERRAAAREKRRHG